MFALHQQLNISGPECNSLALGMDILVIGGDSNTHIFSEKSGNWEESITLDLLYDAYQLSGRNLLATKGNGYMPSTLKTELRQCRLECLCCPWRQTPLQHHIQA